jgi:hypothetical protein
VHLRSDYPALRHLYAESSKRVLMATELFQPHACPLTAIYVLEQEGGVANEISELPGFQRMQELVRHTRMQGLFSDEAYRRRHFEQCARLIRQTPVALLRRIPSLGMLPAVFSAVERHLLSRSSRSGTA